LSVILIVFVGYDVLYPGNVAGKGKRGKVKIKFDGDDVDYREIDVRKVRYFCCLAS